MSDQPVLFPDMVEVVPPDGPDDVPTPANPNGGHFFCSPEYMKRKAWFQKYYLDNREEIAAQYKETQRIKTELGICRECKEPAILGKRRCEKHTRMAKAKRNACKKSGICIRCNSQPARKGKTKCKACAQRDRETGIALKRSRVASGLCSMCGDKSLPGIKWCLYHWLYNAAAKNLRSGKRWPELQELFDRQGGQCVYTGRSLMLGYDASLDHIVSRASGGKDEISNLQWVYGPVNIMKLNMPEDEFLSLVREIAAYRPV